MLSSLLSAGYLLPIVARGFFFPPPGAAMKDDRLVEEAPTACLIALSCTAFLSIVLFFFAGRIEALLAGL
jgi:multicomponent Na+:H+ antiporter subunit D